MMKISKSANEHLKEVPEITLKHLKPVKDASTNRAMLCKPLIPKLMILAFGYSFHLPKRFVSERNA